jgi:hypothetical protein
VPGSPVFFYDCNGSVAQQIRVQEINDPHEVILRAGSLVIVGHEIPPDNWMATAFCLPLIAASS